MIKIAGITLVGVGVALLAKELFPPFVDTALPIAFIFAGIILWKGMHKGMMSSCEGCGTCSGSSCKGCKSCGGKNGHVCEGETCNVCK